MATSVIKQKYHYVDKVITTGTSTHMGYYWADDLEYHAGNTISATVVGTNTSNIPAFVMLIGSYSTRVLSAQPNTPVRVRFLLKD